MRMVEWLPAILSALKDGKLAEILRAKIELLDTEKTIAVGQRDLAATQLAQAKVKIEALESENAQLKAEIEEAVQRSQGQPLDECEIRILKVLQHRLDKKGQDEVREDDIIADLGVEKTKGDYYLSTLVRGGFIHIDLITYGTVATFALQQKGRECLVTGKFFR